MADTRTRLDAGHEGIFHAGADEPCAATGDQQVDIAHRLHHVGGTLTGGVLNEVHRRFGQTHSGKTPLQRRHDGVGTAIGLLTATQHAGAARLQSEGSSIGGDVGAALIDDGDDAHRDADALHLQAVGQGILRNDAAYGVGQCHHLADALGHVGNAPLRQGEAIQHHLGDVTASRLHIEGVGCQNLPCGCL